MLPETAKPFWCIPGVFWGDNQQDTTGQYYPRFRAGLAVIAREMGVPFIPLQRIFDEALSRATAAYWSYDGIHPTYAGFQLIADAWIETAERHQLLAPLS